MYISEYAVVLSKIDHGENSSIVSAFTESYGVITGFVKRTRSVKKATVFVPGNALKITYFFKEGTMGTMTGEAYKLYMYSCIDSQDKMCLILAACNAIKAALKTTEKGSSGRLFKDLMMYFEGIKHDLPLHENAFVLAIFIKNMLNVCGYGFRLNKCVVTGDENIENLTFLSPKSAAAVCQQKGAEYAHLMFNLPRAFITNSYADISGSTEVSDVLKIVDFFIKKNFNTEVKELSQILEKIEQV